MLFKFLAMAILSSCIGLLTGCVVANKGAAPLNIPVALSCKAPPRVYLGDDVNIEIQIHNLTELPIQASARFARSRFVIKMYKGTEPIGLSEAGAQWQSYAAINNGIFGSPDKMGNWNVDLSKIPPLGFDSASINLSPLFEIKSPGRYTVVIQRRQGTEPGVLIGASTELEIVTGKKNAQK